MPDGLVGVDQAGVIGSVNHQTELMFGYVRDDLVGMSVEAVVPESLRLVHKVHRQGFNPAARTRRNGTVFSVECSLSGMDTADGTVMIVAARDMTRHRREEADRYRMDLMAGVVEYADDATLTSWNAAAEKTVGYSSQEIIGR